MQRIKTLSVLLILLAALLSGRLFYLALNRGEQLAREAMRQRLSTLAVKTVRGVIYDRSMRAITDGESTLHAAVIPAELSRPAEAERLLGRAIGEEDVEIFPLDAVTPEQARLVNMRGVHLFNVSRRYLHSGLLSHVIGYTSDNGGFGIERVFNRELTIGATDSISMINNANRTPMTGLGYAKSTTAPRKGIKLSVDYHIQQAVEDTMDRSVQSGAAVVVDVKTGDIVAMASRPGFRQAELAKYLNSQKGELVNRAISRYNIGSVFKVILAAAAIEEGVFLPESEFLCEGALNVDGREFACNEKEGHGRLTLTEGVARSCNVVFYRAGQALGLETIARYAKEFGFGERVLNIQALGESRGLIPTHKNAAPQELANISIGQGDVLVTPLQVADMMTTIANGGVRKQLSLVRGIVDENGRAGDMDATDIGRVISRDTAKELQAMLKNVVDYGTGVQAQIPGFGAAGKTGSAETGWEKDGETMTHGWFAGYFPLDEPRYACVVLAEDGKAGGSAAAPVFAQIGRSIMELY